MNKQQRMKKYFEFIKQQTDLARNNPKLEKFILNDVSKNEEYSEQAQATLKVFDKCDFGCKEESVYELIKLISPEKLPDKLPTSEGKYLEINDSDLKTLTTVPWACYSYEETEDYVSIFITDTVDDRVMELFISSISGDYGLVTTDSLSDIKRFDFATDKEIQKLVKSLFSILDTFWGGIIK